MTDRFTLVSDAWYGLTMWPGYADRPYHSPILVRAVRPTGGRSFVLRFFNLGYAQGVQDMEYALETLMRESGYLLARVGDTGRALVLLELNPAWFETHLPGRFDEWRRIANRMGRQTL